MAQNQFRCRFVLWFYLNSYFKHRPCSLFYIILSSIELSGQHRHVRFVSHLERLFLLIKWALVAFYLSVREWNKMTSYCWMEANCLLFFKTRIFLQISPMKDYGVLGYGSYKWAKRKYYWCGHPSKQFFTVLFGVFRSLYTANIQQDSLVFSFKKLHWFFLVKPSSKY